MNQNVLAVVAGKEITQAEFDAFLQTVPREQQPYLANPQFRQQCLEQLIAMYSFAQMGKDMKLDETEDFAKILENAKRDILAQMAMRETLKDVDVTEAEMQAYYEANGVQFTTGATVNAKHILMDDEEKITEVLASITGNEKTFEDAAKEFSTCPSSAKGGDLGTFGRGQMVKEFEDAAFEAEEGSVVGPVKTQFGCHLIKVEKKNEAGQTPFDEVKERIYHTLMQKKQNEAYNAKVAELKEKYVQK